MCNGKRYICSRLLCHWTEEKESLTKDHGGISNKLWFSLTDENAESSVFWELMHLRDFRSANMCLIIFFTFETQVALFFTAQHQSLQSCECLYSLFPIPRLHTIGNYFSLWNPGAILPWLSTPSRMRGTVLTWLVPLSCVSNHLSSRTAMAKVLQMRRNWDHANLTSTISTLVNNGFLGDNAIYLRPVKEAVDATSKRCTLVSWRRKCCLMFPFGGVTC